MRKLKEFRVENKITQRTEVIDKYLADISKIPLLNREEENEISMKMIQGDASAKEKIINANLRFVVSVAKSFNTSHRAPLADLISQGNLGLVEAAETFDPTTGFKFISYAVWHIRKQIYQFLGEHSRTIRVPTNVIVDLNRARRIESRLMQETNRDITIDEILDALEKIEKPSTIAKLARAMQMSEHSIALELPDSGDSDYGSSPILFIDSGENPERATDETDTKIVFDRLFIDLSKLEIEIVTRRVGLVDGTKHSFAEIAKEHDYSTERIRQKFEKAIKKIKKVAIQLNWVPAQYKKEEFWFQ